MKKEVFVSTLTNIVYGLAGLAQFLVSPLLASPSAYLGVLMFGSGFHHWHMRSFSRKWDFMAMYSTISASIFFAIYGADIMTWVMPFVTGIGLYLTFKNSRAVIGVLVAILFVLIWVETHPVYAIGLITLASPAFVFNMLGDTALQKHEDMVHGVGWHIPIAGTLMATNLVLFFAHLGTLPLV